MKNIYRESGFKGYFKGNGANVIKIMPETACKFLTYDKIKEIICYDLSNPSTVERLASGATAGFVA